MLELAGLALGALAIVGLGAAARVSGGGDRWALAALLAGAVVTGVIVAGWRDPDVSDADFVKGVLLGAATIWALPAAALYALGRFVRNPLFVALVFVVAAVPLGYWLFAAVIITGDLVHCPPDAYECPI